MDKQSEIESVELCDELQELNFLGTAAEFFADIINGDTIWTRDPEKILSDLYPFLRTVQTRLPAIHKRVWELVDAVDEAGR